MLVHAFIRTLSLSRCEIVDESGVSASVQCVVVCRRRAAASSAVTGQRSASYRPAVGVMVSVRVCNLKAGLAFAVFVFSIFNIWTERGPLFEEVRDVSHL